MFKKIVKVSRYEEILAGVAVGVVSFPLSLGFIQKYIFKPMRITCRNRFLTILCGSFSVIISGTIASLGFISSCMICERLTRELSVETKHFKAVTLQSSGTIILLSGLASLVVFKLLGGHTRHVLPSHLYHPGAFAKISFPAKGKSYAGSSVKQMLNSVGKKYGCHSCGRQRVKYFIADHIPPNKLVKSYQAQVFYPHCPACSQKQGVALSGVNNSPIQTHATTLRSYHIWLPLPLGISMIENFL